MNHIIRTKGRDHHFSNVPNTLCIFGQLSTFNRLYSFTVYLSEYDFHRQAVVIFVCRFSGDHSLTSSSMQ